MTNESNASRITYGEICRAHDAAMTLAKKYRPNTISEDRLQAAGLEWWNRLQAGRIPVYVLEKHSRSRISPNFLSYWIVQKARDIQKREWKKEATRREHGFVGLLEGDSEPADNGCPEAVPFEERAVERLDAARAVHDLGDVDATLWLRAEEDLEHEAVGRELGITEAAARIRFFRARQQARRRLQDLGHEDL